MGANPRTCDTNYTGQQLHGRLMGGEWVGVGYQQNANVTAARLCRVPTTIGDMSAVLMGEPRPARLQLRAWLTQEQAKDAWGQHTAKQSVAPEEGATAAPVKGTTRGGKQLYL